MLAPNRLSPPTPLFFLDLKSHGLARNLSDPCPALEELRVYPGIALHGKFAGTQYRGVRNPYRVSNLDVLQ